MSSTPSVTAVPEEGPPPPSIVERIETSAPPPAAAPTPRATATPTVRPAVTPTPVPAPAPTISAAAAPAPIAVSAPAAPTREFAARGAFGVHVSSFRKRGTAEADARRLKAQLSLPARVLEVDLGPRGVWYRVVVGEVGSAAEASALRERLKEKGIPDGVVQSF